MSEKESRLASCFITSYESRVIKIFKNGTHLLRSPKAVIFVTGGMQVECPLPSENDVTGIYSVDAQTVVFEHDGKLKVLGIGVVRNIEVKNFNTIDHHYVGNDLILQNTGSLLRVRDSIKVESDLIQFDSNVIIKSNGEHVIIAMPMYGDGFKTSMGYAPHISSKINFKKPYKMAILVYEIYIAKDFSTMQNGVLEATLPIEELTYKNCKKHIKLMSSTITMFDTSVLIHGRFLKLGSVVTGECCVCMEHRKLMEFIPCKHRYVCDRCIYRLTGLCPICRAEINAMNYITDTT